MDALFKNAPLFVPGTPYVKRQKRTAAEDELRKGTYYTMDTMLSDELTNTSHSGTFIPGDLTGYSSNSRKEPDEKRKESDEESVGL